MSTACRESGHRRGRTADSSTTEPGAGTMTHGNAPTTDLMPPAAFIELFSQLFGISVGNGERSKTVPPPPSLAFQSPTWTLTTRPPRASTYEWSSGSQRPGMRFVWAGRGRAGRSIWTAHNRRNQGLTLKGQERQRQRQMHVTTDLRPLNGFGLRPARGQSHPGPSTGCGPAFGRIQRASRSNRWPWSAPGDVR
jgi:hypothetical protein